MLRKQFLENRDRLAKIAVRDVQRRKEAQLVFCGEHDDSALKPARHKIGGIFDSFYPQQQSHARSALHLWKIY